MCKVIKKARRLYPVIFFKKASRRDLYFRWPRHIKIYFRRINIVDAVLTKHFDHSNPSPPSASFSVSVRLIYFYMSGGAF